MIVIILGVQFVANVKMGMSWVFKDIVITVVILVAALMTLYCSWVVNLISSCHMELGSASLKIKASYPWGSKEQQYLYANIEKVVYGEKLSWTGSGRERMTESGVTRIPGIEMAKGIKAGNLVVVNKDKTGQTFNFIDRAFSEKDLSEFFVALKEKAVNVKLS